MYVVDLQGVNSESNDVLAQRLFIYLSPISPLQLNIHTKAHVAFFQSPKSSLLLEPVSFR